MSEPRYPPVLKVVSNCARCGLDHENVQMVKFARPPTFGTEVYDCWFRCPVSGDPVLVTLNPDPKPLIVVP